MRRESVVLRGSGLGRTAALSARGGDRSYDWSANGSVAVDAEDLARQLLEAQSMGYADGVARAQAELVSQTAALGSFAAELEKSAMRDTSLVAALVVELALAIAERVVADRVRTDPAVLVNVIERALRSVNGSPIVRVGLHPASVDAVRLAWEEAHGPSHLGKTWLFEADPRLPVGGCTMRHEHGFVEAGIDVQLQEIRDALTAAIPASEATAESAALVPMSSNGGPLA